MTCPGSVRLIERLVAEGKVDLSRSSGAADEGTAAHEVRRGALDLGLDAWDFVGSVLTISGVDYECDELMAAHLQPGIDWLRARRGELIVEHRVDLGNWLPGQFGTLDTAIIDRDARLLRVSDLKYGAGVDVDVVGNKQLRIYALGVVDNFGLHDAVDEVEIQIDQPRCGGIKIWRVTTDDLLAFGEEVRAAGHRALHDEDAPLAVSEAACVFCPVKDTEEGCPAYNRHLFDLLGDDLDDLDAEPALEDPDLMTPARRWHIVRHADQIRKWLAKLHEDSLDAARRGEPDPGSKAVIGQRGNRYFTDKEAARQILVETLGDAAFLEPPLIGIPAAETLLKPSKRKPGHPDAWERLSALIDQPDGKPILVPADDERPAIRSLADDIDDLDDLPTL